MKRLRANDQISRLLPGVYRQTDAPLTDAPRTTNENYLDLISAAQWKMRHSDVISHFSAAALWELPTTHRDNKVHWISATPGRRSPVGTKIHFMALPESQISEHNGLLVTNFERTLVDCMRTLTPPWGLALADSALRRGADRNTVATILAETIDRRGKRKVGTLLSVASALSDSVPESVIRFCAIAAGVGEVIPQYRVERGRSYFLLDAAITKWKLALEYDGKGKYDTPQAIYQEKIREDFLRSSGWTVLRFTAKDLGDLNSIMRRIQVTAQRLGCVEVRRLAPELKF